MKLVFDTNVYIAAVKTNGYMQEQLKRCGPIGPYQVYISPDIILELRDTLILTFGWSPERTASFVQLAMEYVIELYPARRVTGVLKDTDDHIILECALEAKAEAIVTADKGLLKLKEYEGTKIIHPPMLQYLK